MDEVLSLKNIEKSYSGVKVLKGIDFTLNKGEIHCIIGENGAGKSTLIKILSGAIPGDSGAITVFGKPVVDSNPRNSINLGISTIYQDVDLVSTLTVADNIYLGNEINISGIIDIRKQNKQSKELLDSLKINLDPEMLVQDLSPAQVQMLQMVKALHRNAKILIMDEPTASLGEDESEALIEMVKRLSAQGISIIYISHYLEEVFQIAHRITVLKDGIVTGCFRANEVSNEVIIKAMVGREASLVYKRESVPIGDNCLEIKNFCRGDITQDISFNLRKGEILGIGGLVGSGRTELLRLIFGVDKKDKGEIYKDGKKISVKNPLDAINNGICMLGENRKIDGMFVIRSVGENICIVRNEKKFFVNSGNDEKDIQDLNAVLNIKMHSAEQEIQNLSGGNQQKALIARWLLSKCSIIIFDEPTKGVDIGAREDIYKHMIELVKEGKSIIMVSSDIAELLAISDRILVLREGKSVALLPKDKLDERKLLELYFGLTDK